MVITHIFLTQSDMEAHIFLTQSDMEAHIFLKEVHLEILVIAEKLSVAQSIAKVLGATSCKDGYLEGNNYIVLWCVGHLVGLADASSYDEHYG